MNLSPVFLQQFKNSVERILHVKGNYTGGILEMTLVLDQNLSAEQVKDTVPQLLRSLKIHSPVFRNVRLNVVSWSSDADMINKVSPMSMVMMSSYYEEYRSVQAKKSLVKLAQYLKVFHARAKLVIVVTDGTFEAGTETELRSAMQPFLEKKLMQVVIGADGMKVVYR